MSVLTSPWLPVFREWCTCGEHPVASRLPSPHIHTENKRNFVGAAPAKVAQAPERISTSCSDVVFKKSFAAVGWEAKGRVDPPQRTTRRAHGIHELRSARIVHPVSVRTISCQIQYVSYSLACVLALWKRAWLTALAD